jgi:hypothetical protein
MATAMFAYKLVQGLAMILVQQVRIGIFTSVRAPVAQAARLARVDQVVRMEQQEVRVPVALLVQMAQMEPQVPVELQVPVALAELLVQTVRLVVPALVELLVPTEPMERLDRVEPPVPMEPTVRLVVLARLAVRARLARMVLTGLPDHRAHQGQAGLQALAELLVLVSLGRASGHPRVCTLSMIAYHTMAMVM